MIPLKRHIPLAITLLLTLTLHSVSRADDGEIKVDVLTKTTEMWDGAPLPVYPQGQPEVTMLKITIPPGQQLPVHKHPYMNAGILLRGQLTVTVTETGETRHLKAGDTLVELVDQWHYGKNDGTEPAEIFVVYAGIEGQPVTVLQDHTNHTESSIQPQAGQHLDYARQPSQ
ncbi:MAG: cupin domain-containing protein [Synechocystis sp.]